MTSEAISVTRESSSAPRDRPRPTRRIRLNPSRVLVPVVTAAIFISTWHLIAATEYKDRNYLLPRPFDVLDVGIEERSHLLRATWNTFAEAATGFVVAAAIAVLAAGILSESRLLTRSLYPYAVILQTVPIIAMAPIIVLLFSYSRTSIVIIAVIVAFFPIFSSTLAGLVSTDRNLLDLFRLHRAGRLTTLWKLRLPAALPQIATGLRISAGMSVIGATVGEFLVGQGGAKGGLGVAIIISQAQLKTSRLFAEAAMATLLGIVVFLAVGAVSNLALRNWHESALPWDE